MIIIVPDAVDGLSDLVKGLAKLTIKNIKENASYGTLSVLLPKFKIESTLSLENLLKQV